MFVLAMLAPALCAAAQPAQPIRPVTAPDMVVAPHQPCSSYMGPPQARIRNMAAYIEAVVDSRQGVYIQGYSGQWYYARVRDECPRLTRAARLRFIPSPGGFFDQNSALRADGFHCFVDSVTESDGPPRRRRS